MRAVQIVQSFQLIASVGYLQFPVSVRSSYVACSSWTRKTQDVQEGMEKLPADVAQGGEEEKPVEATASDDEDRAAAIDSEPAAKEESSVPMEAVDVTETKPLLAAEQDPAPPVQGMTHCLPKQHKLAGSFWGSSGSLGLSWAWCRAYAGLTRMLRDALVVLRVHQKLHN